VASQRQIVSEAARRYGISPALLWGVYGTETSFGHDLSTPSAGAVGPFQFLPSTARSMGVNPYDFRSAAFGAARYLAQYKSRGTAGMLSAYNAGPAGGIQSGYVASVLHNARSFGGRGGEANLEAGGGSPFGSPGTAPTTTGPSLVTGQGAPSPRSLEAIGELLGKLRGIPAPAPKYQLESPPTAQRALTKAGEPLPVQQAAPIEARELLPIVEQIAAGVGGGPESHIQPGVSTPGQPFAITPGEPNPHASNNLHGILPMGAPVIGLRRKDQGRDVQLRPGQALLAPGNFIYRGTLNDPKGFGPDYPIIEVLSGPYAGHYLYYGHTDAAGGLQAGRRYPAGTHVATTSRTGHNAPPGWLELGYAPGGHPGPFGQPAPF